MFLHLSSQEIFELPLSPTCYCQNCMCGGEACITYPLAYMNGPNTCQYPTKSPSSDLLSRCSASPTCSSAWWAALGAFAAGLQPLPYEFPLFATNAFFLGWAYDIRC